MYPERVFTCCEAPMSRGSGKAAWRKRCFPINGASHVLGERAQLSPGSAGFCLSSSCGCRRCALRVSPTLFPEAADASLTREPGTRSLRVSCRQVEGTCQEAGGSPPAGHPVQCNTAIWEEVGMVAGVLSSPPGGGRVVVSVHSGL